MKCAKMKKGRSKRVKLLILIVKYANVRRPYRRRRRSCVKDHGHQECVAHANGKIGHF